ncbi:MAG: UDP-N-acetylmuramoyl-L-alanyl-D-glutamate--2,6-diaminopimelate ligase [Terriglobales bacterium]
MTFLELLDGAEIRNQSGNPNVVNPKISGLEYDSRRIKPGDVFVAIRGESSDGNKFIDKAIAAGAVAVVTDSADELVRDSVAWAQISHGRKGLARLAANYYGQPASKLAITGITGTNGKSTTAFLLEAILAAAGRKSALIGTIEYHVAGKILPAPHTTPESLDLNRIFAEAVNAGATDAVMEVSSHALAQHRTSGIYFDVAVFTNLTRDHLDYHHTMEEYFEAKQLLFQGDDAEPPRAAVVNSDDESGRELVTLSKKISQEVLTYGLMLGDFHAERLEITPQGTRFDLVTPGRTIPITSPLIGRVNVYNILAAATAAHAGGCKLEEIAHGIESLARVPGRFERVDCGQPFTVVVDYAHTDDALRNLTALAREFVTRAGPNGRVITVFGCGGDRDRAKRPLMGEAAGQGSDFVVLTSDNPRSEDPLAIINDAMVGLQRAGAKYRMEPDRKNAISIAVREAAPGDIVLLAGKGHEKIQVLRERSIPFDDVEVARQALREAGYDCAAARAVGKNS